MTARHDHPVISRRSALKAGVALAGLAVVPPAAFGQAAAAAGTTGLRSIHEWEQRYLGIAQGENPTNIARSQSGDAHDLYFLGYGIDGATAMAEATGDVDYLWVALDYCDNAMSTAQVSSSLPDPRYQDGYLGWVSLSPQANPGQQVPLYELYGWRYVTRMLRVIHGTPAWLGDPAIRARYDAILEFSEKNIFEKWWARAPRAGSSNIYLQVAHMASHSAFIALDLSLLTGSADRRALYEQVVHAIDVGPMPGYPSSLRGQMIPNPVDREAYFWNYWWGKFDRPGSDVSHGNNVISYVIEAEEFGSEWTMDDIGRFMVLFDQVVWPAGGGDHDTCTMCVNGVYALYVDGTGIAPGTGGTFVNDGFIKLGRFDPDLQRRIESYDVPVRASMQLFGHGALNAKSLGVRYGYSADRTVSFAGVDSGVRNVAGADGWTILDVVQGSAPFENHGQFVRCASDAARQFADRRLITQRDAGAITRAAAASGVAR